MFLFTGPRLAEDDLSLLTGEMDRGRGETDRAASGVLGAVTHERKPRLSTGRPWLGVVDDLLVDLEVGSKASPPPPSSDAVHQRSALVAREDARVPFMCSRFAMARPPRGPRRVLWVVVVTKSCAGMGRCGRRDQARNVGDVSHQERADLVRDGLEGREVDDPREALARNEQLRSCR